MQNVFLNISLHALSSHHYDPPHKHDSGNRRSESHLLACGGIIVGIIVGITDHGLWRRNLSVLYRELLRRRKLLSGRGLALRHIILSPTSARQPSWKRELTNYETNRVWRRIRSNIEGNCEHGLFGAILSHWLLHFQTFDHFCNSNIR